MDLTKIVIKSVRANKVRDFISALEELPSEVIQGNFPIIEAYQNPVNETIALAVMYYNKEEQDSIQFNVPKDSKNVKRVDDKVEFEYNSRHYELTKEFESWSP